MAKKMTLEDKAHKYAANLRGALRSSAIRLYRRLPRQPPDAQGAGHIGRRSQVGRWSRDSNRRCGSRASPRPRERRCAMKVIGTMGDDVLISVSRRELSALCGFPYPHDFAKFLDDAKARDENVGGYEPLPKIGTTLPVGDWTNKLTAIRSKRVDLEKLAGTLRGLADLVEGAYPVIVEQTTPVEGGAR
jgi:hypothetical protein